MKKFTKLLALLMAAAMIFCFAACGGEEKPEESKPAGENTALSDLKVGFIFLHDENSTYDLNFIKAAEEACTKLGVEKIEKVNESLAQITGGSLMPPEEKILCDMEYIRNRSIWLDLKLLIQTVVVVLLGRF